MQTTALSRHFRCEAVPQRRGLPLAFRGIMYVGLFMLTNVYINTNMYPKLYVCIYIYVFIHMCVCVHTRVYLDNWLCVCACMKITFLFGLLITFFSLSDASASVPLQIFGNVGVFA